MKKRVVILGQGHAPDADEQAVIDDLRAQGHAARFVRVPFRYEGERERCDVAYSKFQDLLFGYSNTVAIKSGASAPGSRLERRGRWFFAYDADGNQINEKGLPEEEAAKLIE